ncbi:MAG: hypothetical protein ACYC4T_07075 [Melioribacteraceae bacterium]
MRTLASNQNASTYSRTNLWLTSVTKKSTFVGSVYHFNMVDEKVRNVI